MIEHISEQDLLLAFDGELPPDRNEAVLAHTVDCAACGEKWAGLARLSEQVATLECPEIAMQPQATAVATLLSRMDKARTPGKTYWMPHSLAVANTLVAVAIAITCIVLLPSLRRTMYPAAHQAATYDLEQAVPAGYVSLPFGDPALPLDDAEVLPVQLSAEDLALMGVDVGEAPQEVVQAEVLIGMDGWPRAIRIVE